MGIPAVSPLERVREGAIAVLSAGLAAELTEMTTEAGNDLVLPTPDAFMRTPAVEETNQTIVEIITTSARPDASGAPMEYAQGRMTTAVGWEARALLINDGRWDDADFMRALDRYADAFLRVILFHQPRLGYTDSTVLITLPAGEIRYTVDLQRDPGGKRLRRVHVPFVTKTCERHP